MIKLLLVLCQAAFGMLGIAAGATAAGLLDDNDTSDSSRIQKAKDNLIQARNNVVTGADKSQANLNAHIDAITEGDLTDALQNQDILNELNAQLTQGTTAKDTSVYLTQGTVNNQGQEVKGQANVDKGHTYLNINHIDTTVETLNHEIAHHNNQGETSATAMGKLGNFAYNIGVSLNQEDINTHRQAITPTTQTLQSLSPEEQLAITQDNQALLNANEVQRAWEVESGDDIQYNDAWMIQVAGGERYAQSQASLANYCANQGGDYARCVQENSDQRRYHQNFRPIRQNERLSNPVTDEQMFGHYIHGNGQPLTTDQLGVTHLLKDAVKRPGAFQKLGSVESRFTEQIVDSYKKGNNNYAFKSSYKVGSEIKVWAFGSGVISGQFNGTVNKLSDGKYRVTGTINYQFSDVFEDPYDTFNWVRGSYDPNGTPYNITGAWSENIDKIVSIKKMKKIGIVAGIIVLTPILMCLEYYFRSFEIADGVKIKRMINGDYYIVYQGTKIGGIITAVDSWYIYQHYVHGSTTIENTGDDIIYFLIDVCSKEVYQTEDSSKFYSYLEEKNIPEDQMGNYMSGDNVIDMRTHQNKYSYNYHCL